MPPLPRSDAVPGLGVVPCAAWSQHAADLAAGLWEHMELWEDTPSTAGMVREGTLARLAPGMYLPPDLLSSSVLRAVAVGCALGRSLRPDHVIAGASAAWVLLGGAPPQQIELIGASHRAVVPGAQVRTAALPAEHLETLGGAPITSPERTVADLLRLDAAAGTESVRFALALEVVAAGHAEPAAVRRCLWALRGHPRSARAEAAWHLLCSRLRLRELRASQAIVSGSAGPTRLPSAVTR